MRLLCEDADELGEDAVALAFVHRGEVAEIDVEGIAQPEKFVFNDKGWLTVPKEDVLGTETDRVSVEPADDSNITHRVKLEITGSCVSNG